MAKIKVDVTKLGKKIIWFGSQYSTPCKFYIDSSEKMRLQVIMKNTGIKESEYTLTEVQEATPGIVDANKKAADTAAKNAQEVSKAVTSAPEKEEVKEAPAKQEVREEKGSMTVSKDKHGNKK